MASSQITDEMLMAFADGMLDDEAAAQVADALANDPSLMARANMLRKSRKRVRATMAAAIANATLGEKKPDRSGRGSENAGRRARFRERFRGEQSAAQDIDAARSVTNSPLYVGVGALCLLLLAAATGYLSALPERSRIEAPVGALTSAETDHQLSTLSAGQAVTLSDRREIGMIASFRDSGGNLCRQYRLVGTDNITDAVSCLFQDRWMVRLAVSSPIIGATPAVIPPPSNMATVDAYRAAAGAGASLVPEEEKRLLSRLH